MSHSRGQVAPTGRRLLGPLLLCLFLVSGCFVAESEPGTGERSAAPGYATGPYDVPPGAVLGTPVDDPDIQAAEHPVVARLLELVEHTPPGARIRIITRSFSLHPVADALVRAHQRGVRVQIIANRGVSKGFRAVAKMKEEIGTDRRQDSFIHLSRGSGRGPGTAVHQKTWTFSRVGDSRQVVMVGSANLSYYSTTQYSDMYTFVGRRDVWRAFNRDFRDQVGLAKPVGPGFDPLLGTDQVWFFPGWDEETDPLRALLEELPNRDLVLRFAMYAWHSERGNRLAQVVAEKARAGARVQVISLHIGQEIVRILEDAGVEVHGAKFDDGSDVHSKLSLLAWTDANGERQRRIVTGSDNFGSDSLPRDEVAIAVDAHRGSDWRAYTRWYDAMIARADREGH